MGQLCTLRPGRPLHQVAMARRPQQVAAQAGAREEPFEGCEPRPVPVPVEVGVRCGHDGHDLLHRERLVLAEPQATS